MLINGIHLKLIGYHDHLFAFYVHQLISAIMALVPLIFLVIPIFLLTLDQHSIQHLSDILAFIHMKPKLATLCFYYLHAKYAHILLVRLKGSLHRLGP